MSLRQIFKLEPIEFAATLDIGYEGSGEWSKDFD